MTKKNDAKTTLQIHSQAKLEFYSAYLSRYLRILYLADAIKQINIYDVFCGAGIYDDGGKGSPIIAFDAIKEIVSDEKFKSTNTRVSLIVNDNEQGKIERVRNHIESNNKNFCDTRYYNYDIERMFSMVQQEVSTSQSDTRNLIFIDPYGYKNITKEILYQLMKNRKTEIILFLPISHMHRFTQKAIQDGETAQYEPLKNFINSFFDSEHEMIKGHLPVMEYIDCITEALKYNKFYATSYYIERNASNYFALFFMSSHIYGFEKILEAKWGLDESAGRGFNITPMQTDLFDGVIAEEEKNRNSKKLESILLNLLAEPKTNKEIYEETLKHEFLPTHAVQIFTEWQSDGQRGFKVYDTKTKKEITRKKTFYISHIYYKENDSRVLFRMEKQ